MAKEEIDTTNCLTTAELALYLAVSESKLRQSRMGKVCGKQAAIPFVRIGRTVRYVKKDVDRWLAEQSVHDLDRD
jgi:hypothetical protein